MSVLGDRLVVAEIGPIHCPDHHIFSVRPPEGEWYPDIAERLRSWIAGLAPERDILVSSRGVTLRIRRGLLAGGVPFEGGDLAGDAPQVTILQIEDGAQAVLHVGIGGLARAP
ncbi:hypothetical protein HL653_21480 [Sphingomonas sp. AP4-R1]|uniref:hypothetical protein n=1 Tax=Sphingomonas sp. AP4-R1 TaxID=2735134 RepID=UPI0014932CBE|nr:hypothetical protein [Sphingomonas sp. AP4-R1]QJU59975.1 hypothetical protein HL653_21480 [Sphingomonas sp. AP4-R1]